MLVTRENPISINFDDSLGRRLHVSKATLEERKEESVDDRDTLYNNTKLYCQIGDKQPVALCSLSRFKKEMCDLNLEFSRSQDAVFSVRGPHHIAVSGFYLDNIPTADPVISLIDAQEEGKMVTCVAEQPSMVLLPSQGCQATDVVNNSITFPGFRLNDNDMIMCSQQKLRLQCVAGTPKPECDRFEFEFLGAHLRKMIEVEVSKQSSVVIEDITTRQRTTMLVDENERTEDLVEENLHDTKQLTNSSSLEKNDGERNKKRNRNLDEVLFPVDEKTEGDNTITKAQGLCSMEDYNHVKEGDNPLLGEQKSKKKLRKKHKKTGEQSEAAGKATTQGYQVEDNKQSDSVILAEEEDCNYVKEGDTPLSSEQKMKKKLRTKHKKKTSEQSEVADQVTRQGSHIEDNQQSDGVIQAVCANRTRAISPSEIRGDTPIATDEALPIVEEAYSEDYDMMVQPRKKVKGYNNVGTEDRNPLTDKNKQDNVAQGDKIPDMTILALPVSVVPIPKPKRRKSKNMEMKSSL